MTWVFSVKLMVVAVGEGTEVAEDALAFGMDLLLRDWRVLGDLQTE